MTMVYYNIFKMAEKCWRLNVAFQSTHISPCQTGLIGNSLGFFSDKAPKAMINCGKANLTFDTADSPIYGI